MFETPINPFKTTTDFLLFLDAILSVGEQSSMKELFINNTFNFINNHKHLDHYNEVKIKYGLEVMYHFFTKLFIVIIISILLNTIKYIIPLFISFGLLRTFGYGIHAKNNLHCWIFTISLYIISGIYLKLFTFNVYIKSTIFIISFISMLLWAPSDTKGRPLVNKRKRYILKIFCLITLLLECLISFRTKYFFKDVFVMAAAIETIVINPFLYKITGTSRKNYENYKKFT